MECLEFSSGPRRRQPEPDVRARRSIDDCLGLRAKTGFGSRRTQSDRRQDSVESDPGGKLRGGQLLSAISTGIVKLLREHYGRGPIKAKTYALDDMIVVVMRGRDFTALEQTMIDSGEPDHVVDIREDFQRRIASLYKDTIERLTDRTVIAFLSQTHVDPEITMAVFFIDKPLEGFGALELIQPE